MLIQTVINLPVLTPMILDVVRIFCCGRCRFSPSEKDTRATPASLNRGPGAAECCTLAAATPCHGLHGSCLWCFVCSPPSFPTFTSGWGPEPPGIKIMGGGEGFHSARPSHSPPTLLGAGLSSFYCWAAPAITKTSGGWRAFCCPLLQMICGELALQLQQQLSPEYG